MQRHKLYQQDNPK